MRRFSFTTLAMVLMAILTHPGSDNERYAANFSTAASATMLGSVADGPASTNG